MKKCLVVLSMLLCFESYILADPENSGDSPKTTLFKIDYSELPPEESQAKHEDYILWLGDPKIWLASCKLMAPPDVIPDSPKQVLAIFAGENQPKTSSPTINIKTPTINDENKDVVDYRIKFAVPVQHHFRTDIFLGGTWSDLNCAIVVLENGKISLIENPKGKYTAHPIGTYLTDRWQELHIQASFPKKVVSVFLDDKTLCSQFAWNNPGLANLPEFIMAMGFEPDKAGTPIIYLHKIEISKQLP